MPTMTIELNGAEHAVPGGQTLQALIAGLDLLGKRVAVAVNREIAPAPTWAGRVLKPADRVEIVVAIGGG